MIQSSDEKWRLDLYKHLEMSATRHRDILLSNDTEYEFNPLDPKNATVLLHAFSIDVDSSVLQSFEGALGRVDRYVYFDSLGRCFQSLFHVNKRIAVERINYPGQIPGADTVKCYAMFRQHLSANLLTEMRKTIIEWRLRATEPYSTFFQLSFQNEVLNG
jgi:hypothetical protein